MAYLTLPNKLFSVCVRFWIKKIRMEWNGYGAVVHEGGDAALGSVNKATLKYIDRVFKPQCFAI